MPILQRDLELFKNVFRTALRLQTCLALALEAQELQKIRLGPIRRVNTGMF